MRKCRHYIIFEKNWWKFLVVQIYIDDIIFDATKHSLYEEFTKIMQGEFEISLMGELNFFFGLQIKQEKKGIL